MIELLTTPKVAILFATIITIFLTIVLTGFLTIAGLPFVSSLAFCFPLSIVTTLFIMALGAILFHAHKIIKN